MCVEPFTGHHCPEGSHIALRIRSFHASWVWPISAEIHKVEQKVNCGELNGVGGTERGERRPDR